MVSSHHDDSILPMTDAPKSGAKIAANKIGGVVTKDYDLKEDHRAIEGIAARLAGGDRRSIGAATAIAEEIKAEPQRFPLVWRLLRHQDPLVRMRAADALEKASRQMPRQLQPFKMDLLGRRLEDGTPELRWHLLAMSACLALDQHEAVTLMRHCHDALTMARSRILSVVALQTAYDVASEHPKLAGTLWGMLDFAAGSDMPSLRARAKKLRAAVGEQSTS